jgi:nitroimidazol reductase NimA-like FMN-containing flavoprotein (pyridoxamine 5'-phosphate oxidase superfamily)
MAKVREAVEVLSETECWELLHRVALGRLAVVTPDGADIYPMNFTVHDRAIYVRSAPGHKLIDLTAAPAVAFEADGRESHTHWSIVIRGQARRLAADEEIEASGILQLRSATQWAKWNYVRITPVQITGRRFTLTRDGLFE